MDQTTPNRSPAATGGLLRRVHHIGVSVSDLDRSIDFYRDLFGVEPLFVNDMRGPGLSRGAGVEGADLRFCMIPLDNVVLELIEWRTPAPVVAEPKGPSLVGAIHIAFAVDDIAGLHAKLKERGIAFVADPHRFGPEDAAPAVEGATFAYFADPDGVGLEIYQRRDPAGPF
jgi:catechol 2,3-dioxygenase-like lactoylglutathione lyase family enzyme